MAMSFRQPGYLSGGNPYVPLLMNQPNYNNGTLPGGLATILQQALLGYVAGKDQRDQTAANQAFVKGMSPQQLPAGQYGPPNPGGIQGAVGQLGQLGDNPYAGRLAQELLLKKAETDQALASAKDLRMSPSYHEPTPGKDVPYSPEVMAQLRDLKTLGGLTDRPSQVKIYEYMKTLPPEQQAVLWNIIRGTKTIDTGGGVMVVPPWGMPGGGMPGPIPNTAPGASVTPVPNAVPGTVPATPGGGPAPSGQPAPAPPPGAPAPGPGGVTMVPKTIPPEQTAGHKKDVAAAEVAGKTGETRKWEAAPERARVEIRMAPMDRLAGTVDRLLAMPGLDEITGWRSMLPVIPGTERANAQAQMDVLKSQVAQTVLQMYREMSKTGGAVGQVSNFEQQMFQNNLAALDAAQTPEEFRKQLGLLKDFVAGSKQRLMNAYKSQYETTVSPSASDQPVKQPTFETNPANNPNTPHPTSKQEFDALPSGTYFVDPQGNGRIKP